MIRVSTHSCDWTVMSKLRAGLPPEMPRIAAVADPVSVARAHLALGRSRIAVARLLENRFRSLPRRVVREAMMGGDGDAPARSDRRQPGPLPRAAG